MIIQIYMTPSEGGQLPDRVSIMVDNTDGNGGKLEDFIDLSRESKIKLCKNLHDLAAKLYPASCNPAPELLPKDRAEILELAKKFGEKNNATS